jgi:predicted KAP-like P-loop ATPase
MWTDNETRQDFVNFTGVANTVAEIIVQAARKPVSVGVSGAWGVGKSTMIKLIQDALAARPVGDDKRKFVFVEFNAWLYQGYDDARAALMEVIADKLADAAKENTTALEKTTALVKRVNWLRVAKLTLGTAVPLMFGLPPVGLLAELAELAKKTASGEADAKALQDGGAKLEEALKTGKELLNEKESPPKAIHSIRASFEEALDALNVTLVVLIDDLDRCLPETTISTLEAIRLFLFLRNTAFVVAADTEMIKYAVRKHFQDIKDEGAVTSYFDKLIQIPLRVPPLGTQEVRAYLMLLFAQNSPGVADLEELRLRVCKQLSHSWQGKRVDRAFFKEVLGNIPPDLAARLDTAERLAPIMTTATGVSGNPRLIKRFLNALSIRMSIASSQGVDVSEAVLVKLLLFERLGDPAAYKELLREVAQDTNGKATFLKEWEDASSAGTLEALRAPWNAPFVTEWLALSPPLGDVDLRGALYVGREHAAVVNPEDNLSSAGVAILTGLLKSPQAADRMKAQIQALGRADLAIIMDRLLDRARQEERWGVPSILDSCLAVADADPSQAPRLAAFLQSRPADQIQPNIVPRISDRPWSAEVFDTWRKSSVSQTVKNAIAAKQKS